MRRGQCKHYEPNPGGEPECQRGHDIRALVGGPDYGWMRRIPCWDPAHAPLPMIDPVTCDDFCEPTAEELAAAEAEEKRVWEALEAMICPTCGGDLVREGNVAGCPQCPDVSIRWCDPEAPDDLLPS